MFDFKIQWSPMLRLFAKLNRIESKIDALTKQEVKVAKTTQEVLDQVRAQTTILDGLKIAADNDVALLRELKSKLDAAISSGADAETLQQISDEIAAQASQIQARTDDLNNAVVENTPAAVA